VGETIPNRRQRRAIAKRQRQNDQVREWARITGQKSAKKEEHQPKPHSGQHADYERRTEATIRAAQERHEAWLKAKQEGR
jgi:hypothetical protein